MASTVRGWTAVVGAVLALTVSGCSLGVEKSMEEPALQRLELSAPEASDARCMMPSAEVIGRAEVAFEGVVVEATDDSAVLEVSRWIHGEGKKPEVVVSTPSTTGTSVEGVTFEEGETYLVSATGTQITLCGFSGKKTDELSALYDEAFAH